jgi:DnaD/phage-associated family protein
MSEAAPSKNPLAASLLQMAGQVNIITVRRPFVEFTGTLERAMLLDQLLYWTPRSVMGGWIAKTDADFQNELCLTRYSVRTAREGLVEMKVIETDVRKFNGSPTQHYKVNMLELAEQWSKFLSRLSEIEQTESPKTDNPGLSEIEQSLTETTTETTRERFAHISKKLSLLTGGTLNSSAADLISTWLEKHTDEWIIKAIEMAMAKGARSEKYVDKILINWEANGYPKSRDEQIKGAKNGNSRTGNKSGTKSTGQAQAGTTNYSDADRTAAALVKAKRKPAPQVS